MSDGVGVGGLATAIIAVMTFLGPLVGCSQSSEADVAAAGYSRSALDKPAADASVDERSDYVIRGAYAAGSGNCQIASAYALAALEVAAKDNSPAPRADANNVIASFPKTCPTIEGQFSDLGYLPTIARIAATPRLQPFIDPAQKQILHDALWVAVDSLSKEDHPSDPPEMVTSSENHDASQRGILLTGSEVLAQDPDYADRKLSSGITAKQSAAAWQKWWLKELRSKADNGLFVEVASPQYTKYTLYNYYNAFDVSTSAVLRRRAEKLLDLYWADVANEWIKATSVRAGAEARCYQGTQQVNATQATVFSFAQLYGLNPDAPSTYPIPNIFPATSSYRLPDAVTRIFGADRPPYLYKSRRPGYSPNGPRCKTADGGVGPRPDASGNCAYGKFDSLTLDFSSEGGIRRDSYVTPDYVIGTMLYESDPSTHVAGFAAQNRLQGIFFSASLNSRIFLGAQGLHENATGKGASFGDVTGFTTRDVAIIARDPGALNYPKYNGDMRLFISKDIPLGAEGAFVTDAKGWLYSRVGNAMVGIYPTTKLTANTGEADLDDAGSVFVLEDRWAPVIFQLGTIPKGADPQASMNAFIEATHKLAVEVGNGGTSVVPGAKSRAVKFTSLAGESLVAYGASSTPWTLNGAPISLTPELAYDSPYITSQYGSGIVTIQPGDGLPPLVLDFTTEDTQDSDARDGSTPTPDPSTPSPSGGASSGGSNPQTPDATEPQGGASTSTPSPTDPAAGAANQPQPHGSDRKGEGCNAAGRPVRVGASGLAWPLLMLFAFLRTRKARRGTSSQRRHVTSSSTPGAVSRGCPAALLRAHRPIARWR